MKRVVQVHNIILYQPVRGITGHSEINNNNNNNNNGVDLKRNA